MSDAKNKKLRAAEMQTMEFFSATKAGDLKGFDFLHPLKPTIVFATFWKFAVERQEIFLRRIRDEQAPWTSDPILGKHKFTNTYRAADRTSQYLIRHVVEDSSGQASDIFFRIMLFKIFNKIETWEFLKETFDEISATSFNLGSYDRILSQAFASGERLYSAAYIMPSGGRSGFARKHTMHLHLLDRMLRDRLADKIEESHNMEEAFGILRSWPTLGNFLAYQYVTDLNYSRLTDFSEEEFVIPGPGAKGGLEKCFSSLGGLSESDAIRLVAQHQEACLERLGLRFPTLWGRRLQLIDCQNLFCEVNKYARVAHPEFHEKAGRTRIKQKLNPKGRLPVPVFPEKWGINHLLEKPPSYVPNL